MSIARIVRSILKWITFRWRVYVVNCSLSPVMIMAGWNDWAVHTPTVALHLLMKCNTTSKNARANSRLQILLSLVVCNIMRSIGSQMNLLSWWLTLSLLLLLFLIPGWLFTEWSHSWGWCWCLQLWLWLIYVNISWWECKRRRRHSWAIRLLVQSCT